MSVVKSLATFGMTVVATIHSPTPYTFNLFDRLLLLLKGRVVYFGPNGGRGGGGGAWAEMAAVAAAAGPVFVACTCPPDKRSPHPPSPARLPTGKPALDYFHTRCPSLPGLKEGENEAEWLVDLTTQVR